MSTDRETVLGLLSLDSTVIRLTEWNIEPMSDETLWVTIKRDNDSTGDSNSNAMVAPVDVGYYCRRCFSNDPTEKT
jgi:hypothetical protein